MRRTSLLLLAVLASCVSSGTYVSDEKIAELRRGMTMTEVRQILGLPQFDMPIGNTRTWAYSHTVAYSVGIGVRSSSRTINLAFRKDLLDSVTGYDLQPKADVAAESPPK